MNKCWGPGRFYALDGLRGIAALIVVLGHRLPAGALPNMPLAVDFFFALSGFVLLHGYGAKLEAGMTFRSFMEQRCIRLLPLVVLGTALGAIAVRDARGLVGALLIPVTGPLLYPLDPPAWSLLFEMIGSALIAVGLWRRSAALEWSVLLVSAAAIGVGVAHHNSVDSGMALGTLHYGLARMMFGFSVGALIYRHAPRLRVPMAPVAVLFAAFLVWPFGSAVIQTIGLYVWMPIVLILAANGRRFAGAELLGDLSYPVYILHYPLLIMLDALPWRTPWIAQVAVIIGVSAVALHVFDQPVRNYLRSLRRRAAVPSRPSSIPVEQTEAVFLIGAADIPAVLATA